MPDMEPESDVFDHSDLVTYLVDVFRRRRRGFNYQRVAERLGVHRGHLHNVVHGQRPMPDELCEELIGVLRLDDEQAAYLRTLVVLRRARTREGRAAAEARAAGLRRVRLARRMTSVEHAYMSQWYCFAIREVWVALGRRPDPTWVAGALEPPITLDEAIFALETIERLGLAPGQAPVTLSTGHEPPEQVGQTFHAQVLGLAARAVREVPRAERSFATFTVPVGEATFKVMKERVEQMVGELLEMAEGDPGPADRVLQVNVQLFPVGRGLLGAP